MKFNYLRVFTQDYFLGKFLSMLISLLEMVVLFIRRPSRQLLKLYGFIFKIKPRYSMLSTKRLVNLYSLIWKAGQQNLDGDIVECGVWNGGAAAMMAASCRDSGWSDRRRIWLFDSFEGLPKPSARDGKMELECYFEGLCKGEIKNVETIFRKLGAPLSNVTITKGWLNATLKPSGIRQVVLLHVDTDWYESVKLVLDCMYDKIVDGGFIVVDDFWYHSGCRAAVEDFLKERGIAERTVLHKVDRSAVYFQKMSGAVLKV